MAIFGSASPWAKIAFGLLIIAVGLHVAGFATKNWEHTETTLKSTVFSVGLWAANNCSGGFDSACDDLSVPDSYKTGSYKAVQGFECVFLLFVVITVVVIAFYVASEKFREMSVAISITVLCFITVMFGIVAMIIWLAQVPSNHYPGYSFGLCVFAFVLVFLAGVLMIPDIRRYNQSNRPHVKKVVPTTRYEPKRASKYDQISRGDSSYNRKFEGTPQTNLRHYYNPNREPYVRSPPPTYKTKNSYFGETVGRSVRTDIQTPDLCLGRDAKRHHRY